MSYKIIDLCSGTGAFTKAFETHPSIFDCVFANDIAEASQKIYELNHPSVEFCLKDITEIDITKEIPPYDILCAGFPCQPFSIAGLKQGFDDDRTNVFWKIVEIIKYGNPELIILENVKNLLTHDKKRSFAIIIESLTSLGYHVKYDILDTCKLSNIPQHRERVYIVCFKNKQLYGKFNFDFPIVKNNNISDFLQEHIDNKYYYDERFTVFDEIRSSVTEHISTNSIYQYRRFYTRKNQSNVCPTLTANMGVGGHNVPLILDDKGIRKLTPRECFALQGFPEDYKLPDMADSHIYKLAGNAVSLPIISLIVDKLAKLLQ